MDLPESSGASEADVKPQQQSAFARVPTKTLPGLDIQRVVPPSTAAAALPPYTFQPYVNGHFPKPETLMNYVPGFDVAPQMLQQLQQHLSQQQQQRAGPAAPAATMPSSMQHMQQQHPAPPTHNLTQAQMNTNEAFLAVARALLANVGSNPQQTQPNLQPQQLQQLQLPAAAISKMRLGQRGGDDSGTESMSPPMSAGSPANMSRSNSFSVSSLLHHNHAAAEMLASMSPATSGYLSGSNNSLASAPSLEHLATTPRAAPRPRTPPVGA
ncbi:hypothetical protein PFISCL1PPCAC_21706, partial [Pristionchus fissidentatus]